MALRAATDLVGYLQVEAEVAANGPPAQSRFPKLFQTIADAGIEVGAAEETERKLAEIRGMYEPYVYSLSQYLYMELPQWTNIERHSLHVI